MYNKCERCNKETNTTTGSFFNTEMICMECKEIERMHPKFEYARKVENEEVAKGNYNYEGIGLPNDYDEFIKSFKK